MSDPSRKRTAFAVTLEELVAKRRAVLTARRDECPALRSRAVELRDSSNQMTSRYQFRARSDALDEAADLERDADSRESRVQEMEFEHLAARYLAQYTRRDFLESSVTGNETSDVRIITVPGVPSSETATAYSSSVATRESRKRAIVHEFLADVEHEPPKLTVRARDECPFCIEPLLLNCVKSMLVCKSCGYTLPYLDSTTQSMSYSEDYDFSTFSYKRQSHFDEILKLVQGKETFVVPDDMVRAVMRELYAQRVPKEEVTQLRVRAILRKLKLRKAYDHVSQVTTRITGVRGPRISTEMEMRTRQMFLRMLPVFEKFCPKNRKNFLSYTYVLFRCFHILGLKHMLTGFTLLKGREKLLLADETFEKIAHSLGWKFEPIDAVLAEIHGAGAERRFDAS